MDELFVLGGDWDVLGKYKVRRDCGCLEGTVMTDGVLQLLIGLSDWAETGDTNPERESVQALYGASFVNLVPGKDACRRGLGGNDVLLE